MTERPIRVLVVDDDPMARAGIRAVVDVAPDLEVVAEAGDGDEVVEACNRHIPDVALMDIRMQRMSGIDAIRALQRRVAPPRVVALTSYDLGSYVFEAIEAGAVGFLLKDASPDEIRNAVRIVCSGESILSPRSTSHLLRRFARTDQSRQAAARAAMASLSDREAQIARLIWEGLSNPAIADRMHLAEATIKTYVQRLMPKLDADSRVQVALVVERSR